MSEKTKESTFSEVDLKSTAYEYFEANPKVKEVHGTTDGNLFLNKKFATDHAETLEDNAIYTVKNPDHIETEFEEVTEAKDGLSDDEKKLLETELVSKNYNVMKALVKDLKIEVADGKAETLITALQEYKAKIQE